jgi:UDPglucose--hexose-1-phosphate uridylyltransferase
LVWEERWHPLREEWVILAAHRQKRPWVGEELPPPTQRLPAHDPGCTLCPGNTRVSGAVNPEYDGIFTFDNDHPSVGPDAPDVPVSADPLFKRRPARGLARVVCYTPQHHVTLAELGLAEIHALLREWRDQYLELGTRPEVIHVLTFENKGAVVGVSNPHPHGQIYATNFLYKHIESEVRAGRRHHRDTGRRLLEEIIRTELREEVRVVNRFDSAVAWVPYFARYAYETFVAPVAPHPSLVSLSDREVADLARSLRDALVRLDNVWRMSMPYILALHQAPTDAEDHSTFHFHIEIHPPLRLPTLRKYLAGCEEGGGNFLSDTAPELKAEELRRLPAEHFRTHRGAEA